MKMNLDETQTANTQIAVPKESAEVAQALRKSTEMDSAYSMHTGMRAHAICFSDDRKGSARARSADRQKDQPCRHRGGLSLKCPSASGEAPVLRGKRIMYTANSEG